MTSAQSVIDAETSRTRLWRPIVAALLGAGLPVPHRDTVDVIGYSAAEVRVLSTLQPKGWPEDE